VQIRRNDEVKGISLLTIRALFRKAGLDGILSRSFVGQELKLTKVKTDRLMGALQEMGFLTAAARRHRPNVGEREWQLTEEGIRLRGAVAAKPIRRETADHLLSELVERIATLNRNGHFLATVRRAVVFGSYLGHADRIGDVDVAIEIVRREPNFDQHVEMNMRRVAEKSERGRHFANMVEEAYWWQREAMLFLRNRRRGLSLQDYAAIRKIVDSSPHRVLFEDRDPIEPSEEPNS